MSGRACLVLFVLLLAGTILELQLDRCIPSTVLPRGASGTTRVTLACASVHPS